MSNSLLNISMITKESLRVLKNELGFTKGVNRQYDDQFARSGAKIGSVINIRKPTRFTVSTGAALSLQDVADQYSALTLDTQAHVDFSFSSKELTLNIDEFSKRYVKPAVAELANYVDFTGTALYKQVYNATGTPGTTPNAFSFLTDAATKLSNFGTPVDSDRNMVLNPAASGSLADALKGLFQSQERIKEQYEKGLMGMAAGFNIKMDQNVQQFTNATFAGTPLVNGASQTGSTLVSDGWSSGATTLKEGTIFTIANVYAVNPKNRQSTGQLQQFVVTADISDTSGAISIPISPSITLTGAYQTVNALPADNAAITVLGSTATAYPQNLAYHKDAFVLGCADLDLPGGTDMAARATDPDSGLSLRIVRAYDISNDTFPCRIDILYGWKCVYPELACRIYG
jgi:hypothetical protein